MQRQFLLTLRRLQTPMTPQAAAVLFKSDGNKSDGNATVSLVGESGNKNRWTRRYKTLIRLTTGANRWSGRVLFL